jgi:hypothetical protein
MIKVQDAFALNKILNTYDYGFLIEGVPTTNIDWHTQWRQYRTISPEDFYKHKIGVCWDYTAFEAYYFKNFFPDIKFKTYYIELEGSDTHTFLVYQLGGKFYHFESSYKKIQGIHKKNSLDEVFDWVLFNMFEGAPKKYKIYEYAIDKYNLGCEEFMDYIYDNGKLIKRSE